MKRWIAAAVLVAIACAPQTVALDDVGEKPRFAVSAFLAWVSADGARSVPLHQRCGEQQRVKSVALEGSLSGAPFAASKQCTNPIPVPVELGDADFVLLRASATVEGCDLELRTPATVPGPVAGERVDVEMQPSTALCDPPALP